MTNTHPLGPLAALAASAQEWRARGTSGIATWAGLWQPEQRTDIENHIREHAFHLDDDTISTLRRAGVLPGVRDYTPLIGLYLSDEDQAEHIDPDTGRLIIPEGSPDEIRAAVPFGVPIWSHGYWEKAQLTPVRHAIHVQRWLDDYHEPTLAALWRYRLRRMRDKDDHAAVSAARRVETQAFLDQPIRWRDVVEQAVHLATVRAIEEALDNRLRGPGHTLHQLQTKVATGLGLLAEGAGPEYNRIKRELDDRLTSLQRATVVLMYEEHEYLQLTGVRGSRSQRRHLPRGLHLVFSDQSHRRADRIADLWFAEPTPERSAGIYFWENTVPAAYAARKQRAPFRLPDADAVWRYTERGDKEE